MIQGLKYHSALLNRAEQENLVAELRLAVTKAPLFVPLMPKTGRPFSVRMTNMGSLGWVSDRNGYRYQSNHPETADPWPAMPQAVFDIWDKVSGWFDW